VSNLRQYVTLKKVSIGSMELKREKESYQIEEGFEVDPQRKACQRAGA